MTPTTTAATTRAELPHAPRNGRDRGGEDVATRARPHGRSNVAGRGWQSAGTWRSPAPPSTRHGRPKALPPVEQLRADLWSIPVPMGGPLRYVSVYAFALDGGGLGLIDTGWESDEGWAALTDGLASIGGGVGDVRGVLVTHLHFDHLGSGRAGAAGVGRLGRDAPGRRRGRRLLARARARRRSSPPRWSSSSASAPTRDEARRRRRAGREHGARSPAWRCPTGCWRTATSPTSRAGGCAPSTRRGTRPATSASPRSAPACSSPATTCCRGSARTSPARTRARPTRCATTSTRWPRCGDLDPAEVLPAHEWRFRGLADRADRADRPPRAPAGRAARRRSATIPAARRGSSPPT